MPSIIGSYLSCLTNTNLPIVSHLSPRIENLSDNKWAWINWYDNYKELWMRDTEFESSYRCHNWSLCSFQGTLRNIIFFVGLHEMNTNDKGFDSWPIDMSSAQWTWLDNSVGFSFWRRLLQPSLLPLWGSQDGLCRCDLTCLFRNTSEPKQIYFD